MINILIADDNPVILSTLRKIITSHADFHIVCEATGGLQALEMVKDHLNEINIVVLDVNMPDMHGLEVLINLRKNYPQLPVLMLSGFSDSNYSSKCLKEGAAGFVGKEDASDLLPNAIRKIISG
jgi:two-component system, NarL family, invasion response regulator UvrY